MTRHCYYLQGNTKAKNDQHEKQTAALTTQQSEKTETVMWTRQGLLERERARCPRVRQRLQRDPTVRKTRLQTSEEPVRRKPDARGGEGGA